MVAPVRDRRRQPVEPCGDSAREPLTSAIWRTRSRRCGDHHRIRGTRPAAVARRAARAPELGREPSVKPAVSASAYGTWRTSVETAVSEQARWDDEVIRQSLLVQPFADEIVTSGEWSVVFFGGGQAHAVLKKPAAGDFRVQEELGGRPTAQIRRPRSSSRRAACSCQVAGPLLYARVDGVERDGVFHLMELEVNEPFLSLARQWCRDTLRGCDCPCASRRRRRLSLFPGESLRMLPRRQARRCAETPWGWSFDDSRSRRSRVRHRVCCRPRATRCRAPSLSARPRSR